MLVQPGTFGVFQVKLWHLIEYKLCLVNRGSQSSYFLPFKVKTYLRWFLLFHIVSSKQNSQSTQQCGEGSGKQNKTKQHCSLFLWLCDSQAKPSCRPSRFLAQNSQGRAEPGGASWVCAQRPREAVRVLTISAAGPTGGAVVYGHCAVRYWELLGVSSASPDFLPPCVGSLWPEPVINSPHSFPAHSIPGPRSGPVVTALPPALGIHSCACAPCPTFCFSSIFPDFNIHF